MSLGIRTSLILPLVSLATVLGWGTEADAFWFGWFRNNRPLYPAYRPVNPAGSLCYAAQPVVAAQPVANVNPCSPCTASAQPTSVNYAPQTFYNSSWVRMPVTVYRPATVVNQPVLGTANQLQPCTTYRWQLQRSPSFRPIFSWFRPWAAAPTPSFFAPAPAATCGTCTPAATTVPGSSQYYQQSPATTPLSPTPTISPAPVNGATTVPADRRPSLRPAEGQPSVPNATIRRAPSAAQPSTNRSGSQPTLGNPRPMSNVTPIPDLQTRPAARPPQQNSDIPPLLNPTRHASPSRNTASLRNTTRWAVTPINWSRTQPGQAIDSPPKPVARAAKPQVRWDDSGWRSAR